MLSKQLLLACLAACGVQSTTDGSESPIEQPTQAPPDDVEEPPDDVEDEGQHFCCQELDPDPEIFSGNGCVPIASAHVALCNKVLYCPDKYKNSEGTVTCG